MKLRVQVHIDGDENNKAKQKKTSELFNFREELN